MLMKILSGLLGMIVLSSSAFAEGVYSNAYTCAALQNMIVANGYVFISNPNFQDYVVANRSYCSGGGIATVQRRSVPTSDNPECLVNYCIESNRGL